MILNPAIAPAPAKRGSVLVPGLPVLPPNVERHPVPGGGTRTVTLDAGDEVTVIDREGRQSCELVVFDAAGRSDPAIIGASGAGVPLGTQASLRCETSSAQRVRAALSARGCDLARSVAIRLFGGASRAGESASFVATAPATLVASAPGSPMPVDEQCAPSEEDMGYPGHVNCSDNLNAEAEPFGIRRRGGWPAINLFFNTMLDDDHAIGMDDPWSRPGDFVLMRALADLVCFSTGCPSDIDAANGWNPTDIQVRVYGASEDFKSARGFRMTVDADVQMTKRTGFHNCFAAHTRNFIEYKGYWLAHDFPAHGAIDEYWSCRERAVVMDLSPLRKYEVLGPDAEKLMQLCVTRDMRRLAVGQVVYTAMCYPHGGMIDDGTVFRLGDNNFRWIGGSDFSGLWLREQAAERGLDVWVKTSTDQLANIAVQGPKSRELLAPILWTGPTWQTVCELGWFRFSVARLNDFHGIALVVSRTGYTGELGYELFCHPKDARTLFDAIMEAGEPFGVSPFGLDALDTVRIEAGLVFADCEFSDQTDPFEAGIGFTVPLKSKTEDFIGREALERRKAHPARKLVGLDLEGALVPSTGDCVRVGRAQVGEITSAVRSPILGKVIALCRMDVTHATLGTEVEVGQLDGHQKRIPAQVVAFPHFDPEKRRVRGDYG